MKISKVIFHIKLIPTHPWWECKNVLIWKIKRSSSIKTMHGCTPAQFLCPKLWNKNSNDYNIHRIHQIWLRDFFISKLEKMSRGTTVHVRRGGHRPNKCPFWGPSEILLFGRLKKVGETLGKVYRVKRRLCCKIKKNLHKIICFSIFF